MFGTFYLKSSYSMLESLIKLEDLFIEAKKEKYDFLALTDSKLHGTIELFKYAKKYNIKPILGLELNINEPNKDSFIVYVKNDNGYKNILKLSFLQEKNEYILLDDLIKYQDGLIIISGFNNSLIYDTYFYIDENKAFQTINKYNKIFDDFYLGLSINSNNQKKSFKVFYNYALKNNIKFCLTNKTNYLNKLDREAFLVLNKIKTSNFKLSDDENYHLLNNQELIDIFNSFPKLKNMHNNLLSKVNFKLKNFDFKMPKYQTKNNVSTKKYLYNLSHLGLSKRLKQNKITNYKPYVLRLNYELSIINDMDFTNYFLIVYDFVKYAKNNNILVGPGRGSSAGALVSYCLGITEVDPIKYNLMFERFLNPKRVSMPDIDLDFPDNKRDLVIDYVKNKYGINNIASISTFSTLKTNSAVRDVSRALNIDISRVSGIINQIKNNNIDETDLEVKKVRDISLKLKGIYRQTGTHAAGIIVSNKNLFDYIPMQLGAYDFYQTQYEMNTLENLGLVKIDFLGIRNLTIISNVINTLKKSNINLDIYNLNLNDKKTYNLLKNAETTGIFQLESTGIKNVLRKLKPENFEDIVATLALYRPGPMENIDVYIERKNGKKFNYIHSSIKDILKPTYGIIIYQEQIMQIAQKFAGYNLVEADILRVGVSKKDVKILENERKTFVKKSLENKRTKEDANLIYDYILRFANYGFNRSHSVSYGLVSYQMAYLKANYYLEFMKELLNSVIGNLHQTTLYLNEIRNKGYEILSPNINESSNEYLIKNNKLLLPLTIIKSISNKTYESILKERTNNGLFESYNNFKSRSKEFLNETNLEHLINSGALDIFNLNRSTMIQNKDLSSAGLESFIKGFKVNEVEEYSYVINQQKELESIGFNIKFDLRSYILQSNKYKHYITVSDLSKMAYNKDYRVCGSIIKKDKYTLKNGNDIMFLTFTDGIKEVSVVVFSNYINNASKINLNEIICLNINKGKYKEKDSYIFRNIL